jgi:hypothetical protein
MNNLEAIATFAVFLIGTLITGFGGTSWLIWRASGELRGIKDQLKILSGVPDEIADHEIRITKIETVCNERHGGH